MNIRTALLYKKNLETLIEESVGCDTDTSGNRADFLPEGHRESPPIRVGLPLRRRSASEGTPASVLLRLWVLGQVQMHEVRSALL